MKLFITGATGMVGSEVLQQAIADNDITEITVLVRNPVNVIHPKLKILFHQNFLDYSDCIEAFKETDAVIWCLGISQNLVSKEEYIKITYNYTIAAAQQMLDANPGISFLFLSGEGADNTEKSRILFGRIKGKTENALMKMHFKKLYFARPAGILPSQKQTNKPFITKLQNAFVKLFAFITPSYIITSSALARVLILIIKQGYHTGIYSFKELKDLSKNL